MGLLVMMTVLTFVSLPSLGNLELIKTRLLSRLSTDLGAEITYRQVEVYFFPRPRITFYQTSFTVRKNLKGRATALHLFPSISSLLQGEIRLSGLRLQKPDLQIQLPELRQMPPFDLLGAVEAARPVITALLTVPSIGSTGLTLQIDRGRLYLQDGQKRPFAFTGIRTRVHCTNDLIRLDFRSNSNIWNELTLNGRIYPQSWSGVGSVRIEKFLPEPIAAYLFPESALKIQEAQSDLKLDYQLTAAGKIIIHTDASLPRIDLVNQEKKRIALKGQHMRASAEFDQNHTTVSLGDLQLTSPRLNASGSFFMSHKTPEVRLDVTGVDVDVGAFRQTARGLVGKMKWVQKLFAVLKDGRVPLISLSARSSSMARFGKVENFIIKGRLNNGKIYIPGIDMDLTEIRGDTVISNGILTGENLEARYVKSTGQNGLLKLGLTRANPLFHLDIDVNASLSQIPGVLQQVLPDTRVANDIQAFHKTRGRASGKLILGESLKKIAARIEVDSFNLYTIHEKIPFPLIVKGGNVTIAGNRWTADQIDAQIGRTNFFKVFFVLEKRTEPFFTFSARESDIDLAEMQSWLPFLDFSQPDSKGLRILRGNARLRDTNIEGPLYRLGAWKSRLSGVVDNVLVQASGLDDPIHLTDGNLKLLRHSDRETDISIISSNLSWQETHFRSVGAVNYSRDGLRLDLDLYADRLNLGQIAQLTRKNESPGTVAAKSRPISGQIRIYTESFELYGQTWEPVEADLQINADGIYVDIPRAQMCDINVPGILIFTPGHLSVSFSPSADKQNISGILNCLDESQGLMTGSFSVQGEIKADAAIEEFPQALKGGLNLRARDGRIYRYGMVAKLMALLNVTEIFRGRLPDVTQEGFAYDKIKIKSEISDGKLIIKESLIQGASMTIVSSGDIDLQNNRLEMTVLVAPFKSIDAIIKNLPIVNDILGGKLMTVPFRVHGPIGQYEVTPMSPTAVQSGVFGLMKRSLRLPVRIMQPIHDGEYTFDETMIIKHKGTGHVENK